MLVLAYIQKWQNFSDYEICAPKSNYKFSQAELKISKNT